MISIRDAEEILKKEYHIDNFAYTVKDVLLPDFQEDIHEVENNSSLFDSVLQLGESDKCDLTVYEVRLKHGTQNRRVAITQEMFKILRSIRISNALVAFVNEDEKNYRISLLTSKYEFDGDKIVKVISNPRRYSYSLGFGTKTKTAYNFLIAKGKVNSLDELIQRFSVEVVNKEFYSEISKCFTQLVGGERDRQTYTRQLNLHSVVDNNKYVEFAVRLIGRVMFCMFLREKKSENGISLVPNEMLTVDKDTQDSHYHSVLEPLFFELLNTKQDRRKDKYAKEDKYHQIPYLNGGLFTPHTDDRYKYDRLTQGGAIGTVTIPNSWFEHFYEVLNQYNFTVDENTSYDIELSIDPEMLGRIFENLLAEINPETGTNAKKSTGSFYTPRDIVDYMVDSSLLEYLKEKTNIDEIKLKALISYGKEDDELAAFDDAQKKSLINSLYTVTVLDPACGSGAFPIGMLQKISYILEELDPEANLWFDKVTEKLPIYIKKEFEKKFNAGSLNYIRKLSIIEKSIFGIDIQPIAVEIARLRCFLSLVIEEKVDDKEDNRGINALPNLDFKFIIANSLIELEKDNQVSLFEKEEHIQELKGIREEYFNAESLRRTELKYQFSQIQNKMHDYIYSHKISNASKKYESLFQWKPFENEATSWFDPEWMFGIADGFDIVIGNPPYIKEYTNREAFNGLHGSSCYQGKMDIWYLFACTGIDFLKSNGCLCFIATNNWTTNAGASKFRNKIINDSKILKLVDFGAHMIFENADIQTMIMLFQKNTCIDNYSFDYRRLNTNETDPYDISGILMRTSPKGTYLNPKINRANFVDTIFRFNDDSKEALLSKLKRVSNFMLNENEVAQGIVGAPDKAFIIDKSESHEYNEIEKKHIKEFHTNASRYYTKPSNKMIFYLCEKNYSLNMMDICPNILEHFEPYKETLINARIKYKTPTKKYFYLHRERDDMFFVNGPKIICSTRTDIASFTFTEDSFFGSRALNFIVTKRINNRYLCAILNSSLSTFWLKNKGKLTGNMLQVDKSHLLNIPILKSNDAIVEIKISDLIDKIIDLKKHDIDTAILEKQIDQLVYELYGLTEEEIAIVEGK